MSGKVNVAAFITTNVSKRSINDGFLNALSIQLAKLLSTGVEQVTLELQTDMVMMRGGNMGPMLNIRLFHNSDLVNNLTKQDKAEDIAKWLGKQIRIPIDRVLVLFMDTRLCTDTFQ